MKAFEEEIETTVEISSNLMENHNNQVSSNLMENHDNQVSSNVMENQNSMLSDTERPISNPWPYISKYFEFITSENDGNQFIYKCLNCLPEMRLIKAQKRSLFGLRSHITRKHKQVLNEFNRCISLGSKRKYISSPYSIAPSVEVTYSNSANELPQISTLMENYGNQDKKPNLNSHGQDPIVTQTPVAYSTQRYVQEIPSISACENDSASHFGRLIASKLRELPSSQADEVMANILLYFSEVQKQ